MILNTALALIVSTHEFTTDTAVLVGNNEEIIAAKDALWSACSPILCDLGFKWVNRKGAKRADSTLSDIREWLAALSISKALPVIAVDSSDLLIAARRVNAFVADNLPDGRPSETKATQTDPGQQRKRDELEAATIILDHNATQPLPQSTVALAQQIMTENTNDNSFVTVSDESAASARYQSFRPQKQTRKNKRRRVKATKINKTRGQIKSTAALPKLDATETHQPQIEHQPVTEAASPSHNRSQPSSGVDSRPSRKLVGIISCSVLRPVAGHLRRTFDRQAKTTTDFVCFPTGGATVTSLTASIEGGDIPFRNLDSVILHVGVNDIAPRGGNSTNAAKFLREYLKLVSAVREHLGVDDIYLSHVLPVKTENSDIRGLVQQINISIDHCAKLTKTKVMNLNRFMSRGNILKASYYVDDRHITPDAGLYLSYRIREIFGLPPLTRPPPPPPPHTSPTYNHHFPRGHMQRPQQPTTMPIPNAWTSGPPHRGHMHRPQNTTTPLPHDCNTQVPLHRGSWNNNTNYLTHLRQQPLLPTTQTHNANDLLQSLSNLIMQFSSHSQ
jgi:hypothetical protein